MNKGSDKIKHSLFLSCDYVDCGRDRETEGKGGIERQREKEAKMYLFKNGGFNLKFSTPRVRSTDMS